jgi:hypothetical protein
MPRALFLTVNYIGKDRKTMYNVLQAMYYRRYAALEETARLQDRRTMYYVL